MLSHRLDANADEVVRKQNELIDEYAERIVQAIAATLGADTNDALALLDETYEAGRISYDDYSQLFDAITVLGSESNSNGLPNGLAISDDGQCFERVKECELEHHDTG